MVVSVPFIILHTDVRPLTGFSHVLIALCRFHVWIFPNLLISPTPVYIANKPSCELFFCIWKKQREKWVKLKRQTEATNSHVQITKIASSHRSTHEWSAVCELWWQSIWGWQLLLYSRITECRRRGCQLASLLWTTSCTSRRILPSHSSRAVRVEAASCFQSTGAPTRNVHRNESVMSRSNCRQQTSPKQNVRTQAKQMNREYPINREQLRYAHELTKHTTDYFLLHFNRTPQNTHADTVR